MAPVVTTDDESVPYDSGEWVDVGGDGQWRPSISERLRALTVIGLAIGSLLVLAAIASVGGDGDEDEDVAARSSSTTEPELVTTTSTPPTTQVDPASLAGDDPPPVCTTDVAREAAPLRERSEAVLLVLNGTSRNGHAGSVTDDLSDLGYTTIIPSNAGRLQVTTIEYTPGFCAESVRISADLELPGADVRPLPADNDVFLGRAEILVTLGSDSL